MNATYVLSCDGKCEFMEASKRKITIKVLIGYIAVVALAVIAGGLVLSEIRTLTDTQNEDLKDRNKAIRIGSLIADIYENESLARAALQLNSQKKYDAYLSQNDTLLKRIEILSILVNNNDQKELLDSIKIVFDRKYETMNELRAIKANNSAEKSIERTIEKLNSIDPILGNLSLKDYAENPTTLSPKTRRILEEYIKFSNGINGTDSFKKIDQKNIDSIVNASKFLLKQVQEESISQKQSLQLKEKQLIEDDLMTSRQLRNLLRTLELEMVAFAENIDVQRKETLDRSINIITWAAIISFLLVVIFSLLILNDFWKSQRYRKQLEISNDYTSSLLKSREQLINMVSHDLRSPLSTISGYSELLQKQPQNSKDAHYLKHIQSASSYMTQLVEELLEFSSLEGGNITIETIAFNLSAIVEESSENIHAVYTDKPIELVVHQDDKLNRTILSDPFRIKQILYNLIGNAFKFTEKGKINIHTQLVMLKGNPFAQITVKDTGIGISKEKQQEIFNAFTQVDHSTGIQHQGFGLGLAITKKLVDLLQGSLTLTSELNKGSAFQVTIPIQLSEKELQVDSKLHTNLVFKLNAIVVEDNPSLRQLIFDILSQHGVTVHAFADATTALSSLKHLPFDVIITDIQLPDMNGFEFLETVKTLDVYQQQPIVAMTGSSHMDTPDFEKRGFSKVIFKPFTASSILQGIAELFPEANVESAMATKVTSKATLLFDTTSIGGFVNHDPTALKAVLKTFLEDTKDTMVILKTAAKNKDVKTINDLSHRMLSMFKQLKATTIVPFLESLENLQSISEIDLEGLETEMSAFYDELNDFISSK